MRTIVVGDVHGCADELEDLLERVAFASGDRLVFVGDLVARGPASLRVLDIVRATGAMVVRGNHEQKLLDYDDARARWIRGTPTDKVDIGKLHRDLARELRPIDWVMLRSSRIWLDLPEHELRVVHAGIDPTIPFEKQNPGTMMRIRTVPSEKKRVLWGERYVGPPHILFGHNAAPGLQLHPWATGLDTGCVYGGRLTCLVLGPKQRVPRALATRRARLVSVPARKIWYEPTRASA
jgi:hypothetical protein